MAEPEWLVFDAFAGIGGFSCGAIQALRANGVRKARIVGVDCDTGVLAAYKRAMLKVVGELGYQVDVVRCKIGEEPLEWPDENGRVIVHISCPCTAFSRARVSSSGRQDAEGLEAERSESERLIRHCLDQVVSKGYRRWSFENVSVSGTLAILDEYHARYPRAVAPTKDCAFNAKSFGCPSERYRLVATSPALAKIVVQANPFTPRTAREAFKAHGIDPPSGCCISNGNKASGRVNMRGLDDQSFTVTASHALLFVSKEGKTIRSLRPAESAALVGLPVDFQLPSKLKAAQRAIGNVVPPCLSRAIVHAALHLGAVAEHAAPSTRSSGNASGEEEDEIRPAATAKILSELQCLRDEVRSLKRKLELMEAAGGGG